MVQERSYINYRALAEKLKRLKLKKYGSLATFLLDTFVIGDSRIFKNNVVMRKLIPDDVKTYSQWRDNLVQLGVLIYDYNHAKDNKDMCRFSPGIEIVGLINKELILKKPIASRDYLKDFVTKSEMNKQILEAIKIAIHEIGPPVDNEKLKKVICALGRKRLPYESDSEDYED